MTVLPLTSEIRNAPLFRITVDPTPENGLGKPSQSVADKAHAVRREKVGATFGRLDDSLMVAVNRALAVFLGFA